MRRLSTGAPSTRACSEQVEVSGERKGKRQSSREHCEQRPGPTAQRQVAHQPEQHAAQLTLFAKTEQHADDSARASCDDYARQQQPRRGPAAFAARQCENQQGRGESSQRRTHVDEEAAHSQQHRRQRCNGRAPGNPHDERISERVAEQNLHQHACQCQHAARRERRQCTRQAQIEDQRVRERVGRAQAVPEFRHAHFDAAAHQRHDERGERGQHEHEADRGHSADGLH
jgi:hypothetical protein